MLTLPAEELREWCDALDDDPEDPTTEKRIDELAAEPGVEEAFERANAEARKRCES